MNGKNIWIWIVLLPALCLAGINEVDLRGKWKFEIGDRPQYSQAEYDDSHWESIRVPGRWEDQGFPGYDGFAWYRKKFDLPRDLKEKTLFLHLGRIDDCDRVYLNGKLLNGTGGMPPKYFTAYSAQRTYYLPPELLHYGGVNVIAIQVYDSELEGGIVGSGVSIQSERKALAMHVNLSGTWKFRTGDDLAWRDRDADDSDWQELIVPMRWDYQGFAEYDGFAWYRKKVVIGRDLEDERLILSLGRIDDVDEVYLNGERIGYTGDMNFEQGDAAHSNWYQMERFYTIPRDLVRWNGENVIAVRVKDVWRDGGIYEGSIGITTRSAWMKYARNQDRVHSFGEFLEKLFDGDWE